MRVLSTSKNAAACGSGTIVGWLTSAAAAAASPAAIAALALAEGGSPASPDALVGGAEPLASPEESWRLGSAVTIVEPNGYSCEI